MATLDQLILEIVTTGVDQVKVASDNITELKGNVDKATESLKMFGEVAAVAFVLDKLEEFVKKSMELADQIVEVAKANDVSTASVLGLGAALEESGGKASDVGKVYATLNRQIEAFVQGNAKAQKSFEKLGVTISDIDHLSVDELRDKVIAGLAKMSDSAERNALAQQLLGKSIKQVDLTELNADLARATEENEKYAYGLEQAHQASKTLEAQSRTLSLAFADAVMPAFNTLIQTLHDSKDASEVFNDVFALIKIVAIGVAQAIGDVAIIIGETWKAMTLIVKAGQAIIHGEWEAAKKDLIDFTGLSGEALDAHNKLWAKLTADKPPPKKDTNKEDPNRQAVDSGAKLLNQADELLKKYYSQEGIMLEKLSLQNQYLGMTKDEIEIAKAGDDVKLRALKEIEAIRMKIASIDTTKVGSGDAIAAYKNDIKIIQDNIPVMQDAFTQMTKKNIDDARQFSIGWKQATDQMLEDSTNMATLGKTSFSSMISTMDSALDNFVTKGTLDFRSLLTNMVQDIEKAALKQAFNAMFSSAMSGLGGLMSKAAGSLFGGLGGGGGIGGSAGTAAQTAATTQATTATTAMSTSVTALTATITALDPVMIAFNSAVTAATASLATMSASSSATSFGGLAFAEGGDPPVGQASLVGEKGPELFIPKTAGTVIPNKALGGSTTQNNTNIVHNFNFQAMDPASFDNRVLSSLANQMTDVYAISTAGGKIVQASSYR